MSRVVVRIDALVLRGVRPEDQHAVSAGIQAELSRLLATPGAGERLARLTDRPQLSAGDIPTGAGASPKQLGTAAAQIIAGRLLP